MALLPPGEHRVSPTPIGSALALDWIYGRPDTMIIWEIDGLLADLEVWFEPEPPVVDVEVLEPTRIIDPEPTTIIIPKDHIAPTPKEVFG